MTLRETSTGKRINRECGTCGATFQAYVCPSRKPSWGKYCSMACEDASKRVAKRCEKCAKGFTVMRCYSFRKYCSRECAGLAPRRIAANCVLCGVQVLVVASRVNKTRFCSRECKSSFERNERPALLDTPKQRLSRRAWVTVRAEVLERDGWKCCRCGSTPVSLSAHHVVPWRISHNDSIDNLVTLCRKCHFWVEYLERTEFGGLSIHAPEMAASALLSIRGREVGA